VIPREILKKVRKIEIVTRRIVNQEFAGHYHSVFKGRGMSFDEVREYQPGDDIRMIDWNVSARTGDVYVKQYVEERELTVLLVVDASASLVTGSAEFKRNVAAEIAAILAFSAIRNNDRVGLLIVTDRVEKVIPPKKGRGHVLRVITEILSFRPSGRGTDISLGLEYVNKLSKRKAVVFYLSDFFDPDYDKALGITARRHDLIPIDLSDALDQSLPPAGLVRVRDPETDREALCDFSSRRGRAAYEKLARVARARREHLFRSRDLDFISIRTGEPYTRAILNTFRLRARRY
jgi:uncharacterized protein (DUF58 family)